jgi:hypothetical protein
LWQNKDERTVVIQKAGAKMQLRYEEDLVEAAVLVSASGRIKGISNLQIARFHREREKLYSIMDPDERNSAFFRLHLDWFREWGLERLLTEALQEFPLLPKSLRILAFRKARGKTDDGTELYVNEAGDRNGVVAIRPELLAMERQLGAFLRHELMHLQDMVDPAFGYVPELPLSGLFMSQHRVARERYRLLWDVTIDGRLTHQRRNTVATEDQRRQEFADVFDFWPEARQRQVFQELWTNPAPTHQMLVDLVQDPRQVQTGIGPLPGAPCPLCGFPTFAWAEPASLTEDLQRAIQAEFPRWTAPQGACARCLAIFRSRSTHSSHPSPASP